MENIPLLQRRGDGTRRDLPLSQRGIEGDLEMLVRYERGLKNFARSLRREMTDCERILWRGLRGKQLAGLQFYRQKPIANFIVDFYCPAAKLVIEVDGGQHFSGTERELDLNRDRRLEAAGLRVLRISNLDVTQNSGHVFEMIHNVLLEQISPCPSLQKRGDKEIR